MCPRLSSALSNRIRISETLGLGNWLYAEANFVLSIRLLRLQRARYKRDVKSYSYLAS